MRLIDADALKEDLKESKELLWEIYNGLSNHIDKQICAGQIGTFTEAILRIKDAPTIDAFPVVRCEECVLSGSCTQEDIFRLVAGIESPFCCVGKRKDGDG